MSINYSNAMKIKFAIPVLLSIFVGFTSCQSDNKADGNAARNAAATSTAPSPAASEADKIIVAVDIAWHPSWLGTEQTRFFKLDGDKLSIISAPVQHPKFADTLVRGIVAWQRD